MGNGNMQVGDQIIAIDGEEDTDLVEYEEMMAVLKKDSIIGLKVIREEGK